MPVLSSSGIARAISGNQPIKESEMIRSANPVIKHHYLFKHFFEI
jgi:hypothetical protein